jgi:hypothetical protein
MNYVAVPIIPGVSAEIYLSFPGFSRKKRIPVKLKYLGYEISNFAFLLDFERSTFFPEFAITL